jgi:hypothetical protein
MFSGLNSQEAVSEERERVSNGAVKGDGNNS